MESKVLMIWLFLSSVMILLVVGIGGYTRLTRAGLSITEWKPITGIIPPLNQSDWVQERTKYEATPEYQRFNYDISMSEFRTLYLIEYLHRLIARIAGLFFIVPFIYFLLTRRIIRQQAIILLIVLLLGILQAFAGWYMVKSGLDSIPYVSQNRLAVHLLLALSIFTLLLYQCFNLHINIIQQNTKMISQDIQQVYYTHYSKPVCKVSNTIKCYLYMLLKPLLIVFNHSQVIQSRYRNICRITFIMMIILIQILFGSLVSGLHAGFLYNTFPLMDGYIIPEDILVLHPIWKNFFENKITVQFIHRILALFIIFLIIELTIKNMHNKAVYMILFFAIIQIILGISTLLLQIPITLAVAHQIFSFLLFASCIYFLCLLIKQK
ncbi:COX15/CtaA family protein [Wolbachia endosymbiont of Howardula sp.]|uniref:COX15/CtaA family protein n=1 Tax=Wolbachia endosymbiont of Howardula sp. TaxID=2916816 RepID=UPI00217E390D|nr:COX15/CtaA family protein [Wolbachia endosymbiont of Howardula sp.]UWI83011.1 COX15/CtaA family protein [Wolbachia endosymbiont of Howardula sp.]